LQDEPYPNEMQASYLLNLEWCGFTNEQRKGRSAPAKNFRNGMAWGLWACIAWTISSSILFDLFL